MAEDNFNALIAELALLDRIKILAPDFREGDRDAIHKALDAVVERWPASARPAAPAPARIAPAPRKERVLVAPFPSSTVPVAPRPQQPARPVQPPRETREQLHQRVREAIPGILSKAMSDCASGIIGAHDVARIENGVRQIEALMARQPT